MAGKNEKGGKITVMMAKENAKIKICHHHKSTKLPIIKFHRKIWKKTQICLQW